MTKKAENNPEATTMYCFDQDIGFWGVPNLKQEVYFGYDDNRPILVEHNSYGLREEPLGDKIAPSILCCGGSHTWGAGISQDKRYSDLLKDKLENNVINMGHCSLGLDQILLGIMKNAQKFNAKIIVIEQYTWALHRVITKSVNGYIRPNFSFDEQNNLVLNKIPSFYKNKIIRKVIGNYHNFKKELNEFQSGIDLKKSYDLKTDPVFLSWKTNYYASMYELLDAIVGVLVSFCKEHKIKLLFSLSPLKNQLDFKSNSALIDFDLPHKKFRSILTKNGAKFIDNTAAMIDEHKESPVVFPDGHLNEKGHALFSKYISQELLRLKWI